MVLFRPVVHLGASLDSRSQGSEIAVFILAAEFVRHLNDHGELHTPLGPLDEGFGDIGNWVDGETDEWNLLLQRLLFDSTLTTPLLVISTSLGIDECKNLGITDLDFTDDDLKERIRNCQHYFTEFLLPEPSIRS